MRIMLPSSGLFLIKSIFLLFIFHIYKFIAIFENLISIFIIFFLFLNIFPLCLLWIILKYTLNLFILYCNNLKFKEKYSNTDQLNKILNEILFFSKYLSKS